MSQPKTLEAALAENADLRRQLESETRSWNVLTNEVADLKCQNAVLRSALLGLFEHCALAQKRWGEGTGLADADTAINAAKAAIAKATK